MQTTVVVRWGQATVNEAIAVTSSLLLGKDACGANGSPVVSGRTRLTVSRLRDVTHTLRLTLTAPPWPTSIIVRCVSGSGGQARLVTLLLIVVSDAAVLDRDAPSVASHDSLTGLNSARWLLLSSIAFIDLSVLVDRGVKFDYVSILIVEHLLLILMRDRLILHHLPLAVVRVVDICPYHAIA